MAKPRQISATRDKIPDGPIRVVPNASNLAAVYRIVPRDLVRLRDGTEARLVELTKRADMGDPAYEVAMSVGKVELVSPRTMLQDPRAPEVWFWGDAFWLKAIDSFGTAWYHNHLSALYAVETVDTESLLAGLRTIYD